MTTALIVGGDYITAVKQTLTSFGIDHITHWGGRKVGDGKHAIPRDTRLVVMMTDWVNHSVAGKVKRDAEKLGLQVLYARGNGGNLHQPLARLAERGMLQESGKEGACCRQDLTVRDFAWALAQLIDPRAGGACSSGKSGVR